MLYQQRSMLCRMTQEYVHKSNDRRFNRRSGLLREIGWTMNRSY